MPGITLGKFSRVRRAAWDRIRGWSLELLESSSDVKRHIMDGDDGCGGGGDRRSIGVGIMSFSWSVG